MASGTPLLTTKLPGIPKEYYKYIYFFDEENVEGMARTIKEVINKEIDDLNLKGRLAQHFVLKEKNNIVQANRIIKFVSE